MTKNVALLFPLLAASTLLLAPTPAQACGGTFCDGGPNPMPVDQTGEDILFVIDGDEIEAHVRIQYEGEASRFAWVVPVQSVPSISVGSELLFQALGNGSRRTYNLQRTFEDGCAGDGDGDGDSGGGFVPTADMGSGGPDVVFEDTVGAFEVVVLQGGTAEEVVDWLDQNGYQQDPKSEPILQEYLDEGFLFAAFKLTAGAEVDEIHPIAIRYQGDEPCIPLRLTRIAAQDDMGVRAYFLGDERVFPRNYEHVVLNDAAIDWNNVATQFNDALTMAVDEAGGRAFVTDYAGSSNVIQTFGIYSSAWNPDAFVDIVATDVVATLNEQQLMTCVSQWNCQGLHPLIRPLLMQYLPPPDGLDPEEFWASLLEFSDLIDQDAWDAQAFADELSERIVEPGLHAVELVEAWPYLTRLNTTISPHEMTEDPMFISRDDLGDVARSNNADQYSACDGDDVYTFEDGNQLCIPDGESWPTVVDMPYAERIELVMAVGAPQVVVDNREAIAAALDTHNEEACASMGGDDGGGDDGEDDGDGGETGEGGSGSGGSGGGIDASDGGCGCDVDTETSALPLLGLLALGLRRRQKPEIEE